MQAMNLGLITILNNLGGVSKDITIRQDQLTQHLIGIGSEI